jgi:phospholipid/cholesterol/gamma-HCH transport system substrate-binding protein
VLRRSTKIQLILFVVITLLGISYVSAEYIGLTKSVFASPCTISADFPDSGGIFSNAEVTYRGVTVGQVGSLKLLKNGVRVDLNLDNCDSPKIPASSGATVANRSVVGEQYVNLVPPNGNGPFVHKGTLIPMSRNHIPVPTQDLLLNLDSLVKSINLDNLRTTVSELYDAFHDRGNDLGSLLDSTSSLLNTALEPANVTAVTSLIANASTVLSTQLDLKAPLASWTHSLNLLTAQLKASDPDIRHLLDTGPSDLATVKSFINANSSGLGVTLANLATVGDIVVRHLGSVEEILELYPALAAGGASVLQNGVGKLSLVIGSGTATNPLAGSQLVQDPPDCGDINKGQQGYGGTVRRNPADLTPIPPNVSARCTASVSSGVNVRGSANVPGGDPISLAGGGYAYPRVVTQNVTKGASAAQIATDKKAAATLTPIGTSLQQSGALGDGSWLSLLTYSLH